MRKYILLLMLFVLLPLSVHAEQPAPSTTYDWASFVKDSPYVRVAEGNYLLNTATGERIVTPGVPLNAKAKGALDGKSIVLWDETGYWIVSSNGTKTALLPALGFAKETVLLGYDPSHDWMLWQNRTTLSLHKSNGDHIWSRELPGNGESNVALTSDGQEILLATGEELLRIKTLTYETIETKPLPTAVASTWLASVALPEAKSVFYWTADGFTQYDEVTQSFTSLTLHDWPIHSPAAFFEGKYYHSGDDASEVFVYDPESGTSKTYDLLEQVTGLSADGYVLTTNMNHENARLTKLADIERMPAAVELKLAEGQSKSLRQHASYPFLFELALAGGGKAIAPPSDVALTANKDAKIEKTAEGFRPSTLGTFDLTARYDGYTAWLTDLNTFYPIGFALDPLHGPTKELTGKTVAGSKIRLWINDVAQNNTAYADASGSFKFILSNYHRPGTSFRFLATTADNGRADNTLKSEEPTGTGNTITFVSDSLADGVVLKTVVNGQVVFYDDKTGQAKTLYANADGLVDFAGFSTEAPYVGQTFYYKPAGATDASFKKFTVEKGHVPPSFRWSTPRHGEDTLTLVSTTSEQATYMIYRDGKAETSAILSGNERRSITLADHFKNGETIRVVAKTKTHSVAEEKKVIVATPDLSVSDVLVYPATATFTLKTNPLAQVSFSVNGVAVKATKLSATRYSVNLKGGSVKITSKLEGESKTLSLTVPKLAFSPVTLTDEMTSGYGYVLPGSTATLASTTRVLATKKASTGGKVSFTFSRQKAGTVLTLESKDGLFRSGETIKVMSGVAPKLVTKALTSRSTSIYHSANVAYGKLSIYRGTTLIASKTMTTKTGYITIPKQKAKTKLTLRLVTPAGRAASTSVTVK